MCGIVGAVSPRNVVPVLIDGIRRLEYRGYDSSGLAIIGAGEPRLERLVSTARVADLAARAEATHLDGHTGISHTRWATHGAPTSVNAHPHVSGGEIAVVHNGIIENFEALREKLIAQGYAFATQTDTEVIAHLVHAHWHAPGGGDLMRAVTSAVAEFHGAYAIAVMSTREPGRIVGARAGSPLVVGLGEDDHFLASDAAALLSVTRRIVYLEEGDRRRREARILCDLRRARRACRPRDRHRRGVGRHGRARPLSPLHAEGDLRAAARGGRHARRCREHRRAPLRRRRRADPRAGRQRARAGLRHELLLRARREAVDRIAGEDPVPGRDRQRIPLPRQRAQPQRAGGGRLAVRRDRRHARRAEARAGAGPRAHADDLQRRDELDGAADRAHLPDARRRRDRRRVDQGVHHPARRALPARADAREAARPPLRRRKRRTGCAACGTCRRRCRRPSPSSRS